MKLGLTKNEIRNIFLNNNISQDNLYAFLNWLKDFKCTFKVGGYRRYGKDRYGRLYITLDEQTISMETYLSQKDYLGILYNRFIYGKDFYKGNTTAHIEQEGA